MHNLPDVTWQQRVATLEAERRLLCTHQHSFQDRVRQRVAIMRENAGSLREALGDYYDDLAPCIDQVSVAGCAIVLGLIVDDLVVRNPTAPVTVVLYSPFQRAFDPGVPDDAALIQRSSAEPRGIYLRMDDIRGLADALALASATATEAETTLASPRSSPEDQDAARQAMARDLPGYQDEVQRLVAISVQRGVIFFRGTLYTITPADSMVAAVRLTLTQPSVLPALYSRIHEVAHRVGHANLAISTALLRYTDSPDLRALGVYRPDGSLDEAHALVTTLRDRLAVAEREGRWIRARDLRDELERPPFGWDRHVVAVGLALLLRAEECQLYENGTYLIDPRSASVMRALSQEPSFEALEVRAVTGHIAPTTLREIRDQMETLFDAPFALDVTILHDVLDRALDYIRRRARGIRWWADSVHCPLPRGFIEACPLVDDLIVVRSATQQLYRFQARVETVREYLAVLDRLEEFRATQGVRFVELRDFYRQLRTANPREPYARLFLELWHGCYQDGTMTDMESWRELETVYPEVRAVLAE